jgi:hypothetical protein
MSVDGKRRLGHRTLCSAWTSRVLEGYLGRAVYRHVMLDSPKWRPSEKGTADVVRAAYIITSYLPCAAS